MKKYVLAIDQGTTSTRAILFDRDGNLCFSASRAIDCLYPKSGWVEQDALQILISVADVINEVLIKANCSYDEIDSFGITNQRETTVVWNKKTGMPIYKAIVWQSRQSEDICDSVADKQDFIHERTGLRINPYFSASKIRFILDEVPGAQKMAEDGELLFGTIDCWLIFKLTRGKVHATDVTNASRTMLFNINNLEWDPDLCKLFNIPMSMLPEVKESSDDYGVATMLTDKIHICGVAGDQQSALFGQNCFNVGDAKNTYGTGCFMLMNIGEKPIMSKLGLLTTIAWKIDGKVNYALEGSVFIGGALIQWVRDQLGLISSAEESEEMASKVPNSDGVYIVPAFVGLGTPYWDNDVRGTMFGLTRATNKYHIVRAALESIAFQSKDVFDVMKMESGLSFTTLKVDGGATANNELMNFQADILNCDIVLPKCLETTALGAAYLAGLKTKFWKNVEEIQKTHLYTRKFHPAMTQKQVDKLCDGWKKAIEATRKFRI